MRWSRSSRKNLLTILLFHHLEIDVTDDGENTVFVTGKELISDCLSYGFCSWFCWLLWLRKIKAATRRRRAWMVCGTTNWMVIVLCKNRSSSTYGHSQLKTGHPVRSAIHKQLNGRLVLRWVTTWESLLLYVLHICFYSRYTTNWHRILSALQLCLVLHSIENAPLDIPYLI
jgi:hypothetical protein